MKYDPNWLTKEKMKNWKRQEKRLTHIKKEGNSLSAICGQGFYTGISTVPFPSINELPGCRQCREIFLKSINVPFDENGYPIKKPSGYSELQPCDIPNGSDEPNIDYWSIVPLDLNTEKRSWIICIGTRAYTTNSFLTGLLFSIRFNADYFESSQHPNSLFV